MDLSISDDRIFETIVVQPDDDEKYENVYLYYSMDSGEHLLYHSLEDASGTYQIRRCYLDSSVSDYDAFAIIHPTEKDMPLNPDNPVRRQLRTMWKENHNNPVIALLKFK